jgi:hypothetical protein
VSILAAISSVVSGVAAPIAGVFTAKEARKQAKDSGVAKIQLAKVDGENSLNLSDAEWEAVNAKENGETWKDEYVTVTMTAWIWVGLCGAIAQAFGHPEILDGVNTFVILCTANSINVGVLTSTVVMSAVGLKLWRGR